MSEWWTYHLSDFLLFSPRTYYRLFELYNAAIWPAQIVALGAGSGGRAALAPRSTAPGSGRIVGDPRGVLALGRDRVSRGPLRDDQLGGGLFRRGLRARGAAPDRGSGVVRGGLLVRAAGRPPGGWGW